MLIILKDFFSNSSFKNWGVKLPAGNWFKCKKSIFPRYTFFYFFFICGWFPGILIKWHFHVLMTSSRMRNWHLFREENPVPSQFFPWLNHDESIFISRPNFSRCCFTERRFWYSERNKLEIPAPACIVLYMRVHGYFSFICLAISEPSL